MLLIQFSVPPHSMPASELHLVPRPLPSTLKHALEALRANEISMVEIGPGLANAWGTYHWGDEYVYLVPDTKIDTACTLLLSLGFGDYDDTSTTESNTPTSCLTLLPRSSVFLCDTDVEYEPSRSAFLPNLFSAIKAYINMLCRKQQHPYALETLFTLVQCLKQRCTEAFEPLKEGETAPSYTEWRRMRETPQTESEIAAEHARQCAGLEALDKVDWVPVAWLKETVQKLIKNEFDMDLFTGEWWIANTGTDLDGVPLPSS